MKSLKNIVGTLLVASLTSCSLPEYKVEYSEVKNVNAVVSSKVHIPEENNTAQGAAIGFVLGSGIRSGKSGNMGMTGMAMGGMLGSASSESEKYTVHFDGNIDFSVDNKDIFDRVNSNEQVSVFYKDSYEVKYADNNKDGIKEEVSRRFLEHQVVDVKSLEQKL